MHAAVLERLGTPVYADFDEPHDRDGAAVVRVLAAGLNPADLAMASGAFGRLSLPRVAGLEGVGLLGDQRVYFSGPIEPFGSMAERTLVDPSSTIPVPDGVDDASAVALGIAGLTGWLALSWRARLRPGEHVLVLGASGEVGMAAVQAARLLGAGRIVAAARSERRLAVAKERGAHATVTLDTTGGELTAAVRAASDDRLDVIVDPLWGPPALAAMRALTAGGRLVQIGSSGGAEIALNPGFMRGTLTSILGFSSGSVPMADRAEAYGRMCRHVLAGELVVDTEEVPLVAIEAAWARQAASPHRKLVIVP